MGLYAFNMFSVYVLHSEAFDKIYVGYSSNLEQRVIAHNHPKNKGWTKRYQPWVLVHSEEFSSKGEAMTRERQLKSAQGRVWIRKTLLSQ